MSGEPSMTPSAVVRLQKAGVMLSMMDALSRQGVVQAIEQAYADGRASRDEEIKALMECLKPPFDAAYREGAREQMERDCAAANSDDKHAICVERIRAAFESQERTKEGA